jgi:hypothetical protein
MILLRVCTLLILPQVHILFLPHVYIPILPHVYVLIQPQMELYLYIYCFCEAYTLLRTNPGLTCAGGIRFVENGGEYLHANACAQVPHAPCQRMFTWLHQHGNVRKLHGRKKAQRDPVGCFSICQGKLCCLSSLSLAFLQSSRQKTVDTTVPR